MVVGENESTTMKNAGELLAISIAMQMWWCNTGHIPRWSTSRASLNVLPLRPPWLTNLLKQRKTLTKHNF